MKILRKEVDMVGKWRVWVDIDQPTVVIFKFSDDPTEDMIMDRSKKLKEAEVLGYTTELESIDLQVQNLLNKKIALEEKLNLKKTPMEGI